MDIPCIHNLDVSSQNRYIHIYIYIKLHITHILIHIYSIVYHVMIPAFWISCSVRRKPIKRLVWGLGWYHRRSARKTSCSMITWNMRQLVLLQLHFLTNSPWFIKIFPHQNSQVRVYTPLYSYFHPFSDTQIGGPMACFTNRTLVLDFSAIKSMDCLLKTLVSSAGNLAVSQSIPKLEGSRGTS